MLSADKKKDKKKKKIPERGFFFFSFHSQPNYTRYGIDINNITSDFDMNLSALCFLRLIIGKCIYAYHHSFSWEKTIDLSRSDFELPT